MKFLFLLLLAFPLHAYDAQAVYADYLASESLGEAIEEEAVALAEAVKGLSAISASQDKADFIQKELMPKAEKIASNVQKMRALLKTKEAIEALNPILEACSLVESIVTNLLKAYKDSDSLAMAEAMHITAELIAFPSEKSNKKYKAFLKKLRKEMKKAKMPKNAIEGVKYLKYL